MEYRQRGLEDGKCPHARHSRGGLYGPFCGVLGNSGEHTRQTLGNNYLAGLVEWWPLMELRDKRFALYGGNHFTQNNGVGQASGAGTAQYNMAASFASASTQFLNVADTGGVFDFGNIDWTWVIWAYWDNTAGGGGRLLYKGNDAFTRVNYFIYVNNPSWQFGFTDSAGNFKQGALALATITWQMLCLQHDAAADTIGLSINGGAFTTAATGNVAPYTGTEDLKIGQLSGTVSRPFNGRAARVGAWKRKLSANEITRLYNGSVGLDFPFFS